MYTLRTVPLSQVQICKQPRTNLEETDMSGLATSLGEGEQPLMAQLPIVYLGAEATDTYIVIAGERRVQAAQMAGFKQLQVLVNEDCPSGTERHRLALLENLHRAELHPLDEAVALKLYCLQRNAAELGLTTEAEALFEAGEDLMLVLSQLQALLEESGWIRHKPVLSYEACLAELGLTMSRSTLMRKLRVLNLDLDVIERIRQIGNLTEAAIRAIGRLAVDDQRALLDAISEMPDLASRVRRICSTLDSGFYQTIEEAIAEARGEVFLPRAAQGSTMDEGYDGLYGDEHLDDEEECRHHTASDDEGGENRALDTPSGLAQAVIDLLDVATTLESTLHRVHLARREAPEAEVGAWQEMLSEAIGTMKRSLSHWP